MSNIKFIPFHMSKLTWALIGISALPVCLALIEGKTEGVINEKCAGVVACFFAGLLIDSVFWFAKNWKEP